jgi:hypothetical protein
LTHNLTHRFIFQKMETISAAGEENEGVGVGVAEGKPAEPVVLGGGSSRPIRKIRQPLKELNSDSCCGGGGEEVVKKVAPLRIRAPAKRKSRSTKGRNSKRAKKTATVEVNAPEEVVKDEAPVLEKMNTQTKQEEDIKLAGENQGFEAR